MPIFDGFDGSVVDFSGRVVRRAGSLFFELGKEVDLFDPGPHTSNFFDGANEVIAMSGTVCPPERRPLLSRPVCQRDYAEEWRLDDWAYRQVPGDEDALVDVARRLGPLFGLKGVENDCIREECCDWVAAAGELSLAAALYVSVQTEEIDFETLDQTCVVVARCPEGSPWDQSVLQLYVPMIGHRSESFSERAAAAAGAMRAKFQITCSYEVPEGMIVGPHPIAPIGGAAMCYWKSGEGAVPRPGPAYMVAWIPDDEHIRDADTLPTAYMRPSYFAGRGEWCKEALRRLVVDLVQDAVLFNTAFMGCGWAPPEDGRDGIAFEQTCPDTLTRVWRNFARMLTDDAVGICRYCGRPFSHIGSRGKPKVYCSERCRESAKKKRRYGRG